MTLTRGALQSLIKKISKGTPGKGMDDDVQAVIKREPMRTLKDHADYLRGGKGSYDKEKKQEKDTAKQNERIRAVQKYITGYAKGGYTGGDQPAALSEGEYVIPADCVSLLGDGNSEAGAKILAKFCEQLRKTKGKHLAKGKQAPKYA